MEPVDRDGTHIGQLESVLRALRAAEARGDFQAIVARFGRVHERPTDDAWGHPDVVATVGRAYGMLGDEDHVELYLLRSAELAPRRAAVFHCSIGWFFQRKKKWTKALRWYDRALESFPTYHLCLFRRGYCLEKLHRPREAVDALARARTVWDQAGPDQRQRGRGVQVQVLFHLSRVLRDLGDFEAASDALETCRTLNDTIDPPAILPEHILACAGELELRHSRLEEALVAFERARDIDPSSSYVWERIGRVHELRGDHSEAEACYQHAVTLPRGAFAHLALGRFHTNVTHRLPEAAHALSEALRGIRSAEPLVRLELARLHMRCNRLHAARAQVEQALACRREGGFIDGLRLAVEITERLGDLPATATYLRQLARALPDPALEARADALALEASAPPVLPIDPPLPVELALLADATLDVRGRERVHGVVDRFFGDKGYGFVRYGAGETLFFHVTQVEEGDGDIGPGTPVSFIVGHNPKKGKPQAEDVRLG